MEHLPCVRTRLARHRPRRSNSVLDAIVPTTSVRQRTKCRIGGCARVPAMKTFAGGMQHLLRKRLGDDTTPCRASTTMSGWPFVGKEFCDGPEIASNDGIATRSASSADEGLPANGKASAGRNADRITRFLADHRPAIFCDYCIADKLGLSNRREANRSNQCAGQIIGFLAGRRSLLGLRAAQAGHPPCLAKPEKKSVPRLIVASVPPRHLTFTNGWP